jgi:hypothetical protein
MARTARGAVDADQERVVHDLEGLEHEAVAAHGRGEPLVRGRLELQAFRVKLEKVEVLNTREETVREGRWMGKSGRV